MSDEGPKLFTNKPKKSKLKASTPITMASSSSSNAAATPPPPPPPPPQKLSFFQRNRFLVPLLLAVNFTVGAYLFTRTSTKDKGKSEEEIPDHPTSSTSTSTATAPAAAAAIIEKPVTPPIMEPIQRPPIPEDQQRELFKWMLEERRKMKPKDPEEKNALMKRKPF